MSWQQCFEESLECYTRAAELYGEVEHLSPAGILRLGRVRASMGLVHERMSSQVISMLFWHKNYDEATGELIGKTCSRTTPHAHRFLAVCERFEIMFYLCFQLALFPLLSLAKCSFLNSQFWPKN